MPNASDKYLKKIDSKMWNFSVNTPHYGNRRMTKDSIDQIITMLCICKNSPYYGRFESTLTLLSQDATWSFHAIYVGSIEIEFDVRLLHNYLNQRSKRSLLNKYTPNYTKLA